MSDRLKGKRLSLPQAGGRPLGGVAFSRAGATVFATDIGGKGARRAQEQEGIASRRARRAQHRRCYRNRKRTGPVDILLNAAGFVHRHRARLLRRGLGFSFDLNVKSMRTVRAPSCRACWNAAAARSSISPRPPACSGAAPNRPTSMARPRPRCGADGRSRPTSSPGHPLQLHLQAPSRRPRCWTAPPPPGRRAAKCSSAGSRWDGSAPPTIAALAVYLASDESAFTTGIAHLIDGGWTL